MTPTTAPKRIGILVVAYNAATTLAAVLDRIPEDFRPSITTVLVGDDHSQDQTHLVAVGYQSLAPDLPIQVTRHERNLGYGGNQKWGYRTAIEQDLDVIVLLHGDGQYAPELLPDMVAPLLAGEADAVMGSRMMVPGGARRGGMPLYKYVGNRILTTVENALAGVELSEWHSGYRAYSVEALRQLPFERNSDGFDFDTQIILQLIETGQRIVEIPIPTYYGDEISHVNGLKYAKDITQHVLRYRAHKMGFGTGDDVGGDAVGDQPEGFGDHDDVGCGDRAVAERGGAGGLDRVEGLAGEAGEAADLGGGQGAAFDFAGPQAQAEPEELGQADPARFAVGRAVGDGGDDGRVGGVGDPACLLGGFGDGDQLVLGEGVEVGGPEGVGGLDEQLCQGDRVVGQGGGHRLRLLPSVN